MAVAVAAAEHFAFADGGTGHACVFAAGPPSAGDHDVLCVNSNTVVSTPAGFTAGPTAVTNQGAYIFRRKAAGGESGTVTVTTSGDHPTNVLWLRVSGADAADVAESAQINSNAGTSTPAFTSSALAVTGELAVAFAALHGPGGAAPSAPVWSSGYTEVLSGGDGGTGLDNVYGTVAAKVPAGTAAESPSCSWTGAVQNRYLLFLTLTAADAGDGDATVTPDTVTATASAPAPTAAASGTATPATVAVVTAAPTASPSAGSRVIPSAVAAATAIPAAALSTSATPAPATVTAVTATPTAAASASATVTPATAGTAAGVNSPVLSPGSTVTAQPVTATITVSAPAVASGVTLTTVPVAGAAAVPAVTISTLPPRNLNVTVAPPQTRWRVGPPRP